jgi:DNA-binding NarL/FixJ family response regulator
VSSGYTNDTVVQNFMQYGFSGRLSKPYKINDLKQILEQVIKNHEMGPASSGPIRF